MNKKIVWIIVILLILIIIFAKTFSNGNNNEKEFKPIDKNIGDEFSEISYPNKMYIINYDIADINNDNTKEMIMLVGESNTPDELINNSINNMDVVIYSTNDNTFINAGMKNFNR